MLKHAKAVDSLLIQGMLSSTGDVVIKDSVVVGKDLDANGHAIGQADAFLNNSATIDVQGNLSMNTGLFMNKDLYGTSVSGTNVEKYIVYTKVDAADPGGNSIRFTGGKWDDHTGAARNCVDATCPTDEQWNALYANPQTNGDATHATYVSTAGSWTKNDGTYVLTTNEGDVINNPIWRLDFVTKTTTTSGEIGVDPASILVGGNMTLNAGTAVNDKSKIIVGGALTVTADNLQNIGGGGSSVMTQHDESWDSKVLGGTRSLSNFAIADWTPISNYWSSTGEVTYNTVPVHTGTAIDNRKDVVVAIAQPAIANPNRPAGQAHAAVANTAGAGTVAPTTAVSKVAGPGGVGMVVRTGNGNTAQLPNNSLYQILPNHSPKGYLVETDPRFTQNKTWLGSDYMLKQLDYDPATQTQRLGDGFYEQKLLREQIAQLTGRRFIDDYTSDEEEYKALMNAGVQFAKQYKLIPGVALTPEQMALLTTDIVWLIEKEVTLPDGSKTKALVPQVYALVKPGDIDGSGNLMSAKTIDLKLKGDMVNSGLMAARGNLSIDAANITNLTGTLKGMDVSLIAAGDFQSIQGNIVAGKALKINAGNDVVVLAGNITAGAVPGGGATISAGHDLLLLAQDKGRQVSANWGAKDKDGKLLDPNNKDNYVSYGTYDQTGVSMNIGGALTMSAGNDFVAQGSQINAGAVSVSAGRDATITTAQHGSFYESSQIRKESTWFGLGSKTTTHITRNTDITNTETNWNAGAINVGAGRDLTIVGGNFNAGSINLNAGNNANILAAYDIKEKISINAVKSNDIGRLLTTTFNGPALNGSINARPTDTSTTDIDSTRTAKLVNLNAGAGGVNITAGNNVNLEAPKISGSSLNVTAGTSNAGGKVNLIAAIDSREVSHTVTSRNTLWQSNASSGQINQTLHMANINVPANNINFQGAGGISVQLPKGAALPAQIAALAKQPGNEYLTDLAKRSDIDWKQVEVINKTWNYKKEGITQEAAIIIAIVVTIFTAGAAASAAGSIVGTTAATATTAATLTGTGLAAATGMSLGVATAATAAVAAGITTLATQAAIALLNNKGDIAGALKELGSKENVKGLAIAMLTAGAVQGLGTEFGLVSGGKATLLQNLQTNLVNGVASSLISTAINGGSLEDALKHAAKNAIINALASQGADVIGNANLDIFSSNLAHAILGCAVGSATAGNSSGCAAGAGGAVVGHLSAQWYDANIKDASAADIANFAKLTTALASLVGGANAMNIAGITSSNAVLNNYLSHPDRVALDKARASCFATNNPADCNTMTVLDAKDKKTNLMLENLVVSCKGAECVHAD